MATIEFNIFVRRVAQAIDISSQIELASILGVNRSAVTQARKKGRIPEKWLLQLFRSHGLNPTWLETGIGEPFLTPGRAKTTPFEKVPKVTARLCAGGGSFENDAEVKGYYAFQREWLSAKGRVEDMVLMDIFGTSMEPELKDGDTILIDQSQKNILAGAVYALGIDDTIMVKRVEKHPNKLVLLSDNNKYAPIFLEHEEADSVRIIGKVIWVGRELR